MSELQQIKESRADGCAEALEYYADLMDRGHQLSGGQLQDYRQKCAILQCMGEVQAKYAETMLKLIN